MKLWSSGSNLTNTSTVGRREPPSLILQYKLVKTFDFLKLLKTLSKFIDFTQQLKDVNIVFDQVSLLEDEDELTVNNRDKRSEC